LLTSNYVTDYVTNMETSIGLISVATGGEGKGGQLPPTGPRLDPEIRANPMRSVCT